MKKSGLRSATRQTPARARDQSARGVSAPGTAPRSARRAPPSRAGDGGFEIYTPGGGAEVKTPAGTGGNATPRGGALSGVRWDESVAGRPASTRRVGTNLADRFNSPSVANHNRTVASDSKVAVSSISSPRNNAWDRPLITALSAEKKPAGTITSERRYPSQQLRFSGRPAEVLSPSHAERLSAPETRPSPAASYSSRPSPLSSSPATTSSATASAAHLIDSASSTSPRSLGPSEYAMRFPPGPVRLGLEAVTAASGRPTGCSVSRVPADLDARPDAGSGTAAGATVQVNDLVVSVNGVPVLSRKFDIISDLFRRLESEEKVIVFRSIEKVWRSQFQRKTMRNVRSGRRVATALDEGALGEGGLQTWVETPTQVEVRRRGRGQRAVQGAEGKEDNKLENIREASATAANPASTPAPKRTNGGETAAAGSPFLFSPSNVRMMSTSHPASPEVRTARRSNAGRVLPTTPGSAVGKAKSGSIADEIGRALAGPATPGSEFERSLRLKKGVLEELREVHLELERLRSEVVERDGKIDSLKDEVSSKDEDARGLRGKLYQAYRGDMSSGTDITDLARERDEARKELDRAKARINELERQSKESVAENDRRLADREKSSQLKQVEIARLRMTLKETEERESELRSKLDGMTSALSDANDDASKTSKLLSDERARSARQDAATNRRVVELERLLSEETDKHQSSRAELANEKERARVSAKLVSNLEKERDEAVQRLEKERASFEKRERRGKATKARHMSEMKALAGRLDETKAEASKNEAKLRAEHEGKGEMASRLGEANETIKSIEGERNKAKEESDRLKTSIDELRTSVDSLETEKASLADQVRQLEAESSKAKSLQSEAAVRLIDARDELSSVRTSKDGEIEVLKKTLRSAEAKLKSELEVSSNEVAAARAESDSLRDANGRLERDHEQARAEADEAQTLLVSLNSDFEKCRSELGRVEEELRLLEAERADTRAQLQERATKLDQAEAAALEAQSRQASLNMHLEGCKNELASRNEEVASLKSEREAIRELLAERTRALEQAKAQSSEEQLKHASVVADLEKSKNDASEETSRLVAEVDESRAACVDLRSKLEAAEVLLDRGDGEIDALAQECETLESELESAKARLSEAEADLSKQTDEIEKLVSARYDALSLQEKSSTMLASKEAMIDSFRVKTGRLEGEVSDLTSRLEESECELSETRDQRAELASKLLETSAELEKSTAELSRENAAKRMAEDEIHKLEASVESLSSKLQSKQHDFDEIQEELDQGKKMRSELESERNDLTATVDRLSSDASLKQSQIDQLQGEVDGLREQLSSATDDLRSTAAHYADEISAIELELKSLSSIVQENEDEIERLNSELESAGALVNTKSSELEDALTERERLMGHIQDLTSSLISANQSSSGQNVRNEELRAQLDVAANQISALSREVDDLKLTIENQKSQIEELEGSKSQLVVQHENEVGNLKDQVESSRQELHQAVAIRDDLRSELQTAQDLLTERRVQIQRQMDECESLKTQVNRLNIALENSDEMTSIRRDESQALSLELTEMTSQVQSLRADIESKEESISKLNEIATELQSAADKHNDEQLSLQAQLDASNGSLGQAEEQCTLLTSTLRSIEDEKALLTKEHALLKATVATITNDLSQSQRNGECQAARQNELEQSIAAKEHDIESLVAQREELLASNAVLSSKVKALEVDSRRMSLSVQVSESQSLAERRDLENLRAGDRLKVVQLSSKVDALEASLRSKEAELSRLADEKENLLAKVDADGVITSQLDESKRQLEEERNLSTKLASELESLSATLSSKEGEILHLKHDIVRAEERVASLMSQVRISEDSLKSQLSVQSLNHEKLMNEFQERMNDLTEDRDSISGELQKSLVSLAQAESNMARKQNDVEELTAKVTLMAHDLSSLQERYDRKSSELKSFETRVAEGGSHCRKVQMLEDEVQAQKLLNSNLTARLKMEKVLDRRDATLSKMIDTVSSLRATSDHDASSNLDDELSALKTMLKSREIKIEQLSSDLSSSQESLRKLRDTTSSEASQLTKSLEEKLSEATSKFEEQRSSFKAEWVNFQQVLQELIVCMKHEDGVDSIDRLPDLSDQMSTLFSLVQSKEEHLVRVQTELAQLKSVRDTRATELDAILDNIRWVRFP